MNTAIYSTNTRFQIPHFMQPNILRSFCDATPRPLSNELLLHVENSAVWGSDCRTDIRPLCTFPSSAIDLTWLSDSMAPEILVPQSLSSPLQLKRRLYTAANVIAKVVARRNLYFRYFLGVPTGTREVIGVGRDSGDLEGYLKCGLLKEVLGLDDGEFGWCWGCG